MTRLIIFLAFFLFGSIAANLYQFAEHRQERAELTATIVKQRESIDFFKDEAEKAERIAERRRAEVERIDNERRQALNELERLKHEDPGVKNWANTDIPYSIERLLNEGRSGDYQPTDSSESTPRNNSKPPDIQKE